MENQASVHDFDCPEFEDIETSSSGYASRFAGRSGAWLLKVQRDIAQRCLQHAEKEIDAPIEEILDVAGGHGQIARAFCSIGRKVIVAGSSSSCDAQIKDLIVSGMCQLRVCDLLKLPFADSSFSLVTCFRFLPHCSRWQDIIAELCRVSECSIIVDYPPKVSFNALYPLLYGLKRQLEGNTRHFTLFSHQEIDSEFLRHGFRRVEAQGEFFFPMVLHRVLDRPEISRCLEALPWVLGLTRYFGSPVIARYSKLNS